MDQIRAGRMHFGWDSTLQSYMGVMRRGGDGRDLRWLTGQQLMCTHTMGAWSEGEKLYVDMDGGEGNQFPFFPSLHEPFDPMKAIGRVRRFTIDLSKKSNKSYQVETLYPEISGVLSRQDDRYHTVPYRHGFLLSFDRDGAGWAMFDHQKRTVKRFSLGPDVSLAEMCFVPRKAGAPEGDGYLIGVADHLKENGRSDLILVDTDDFDAGPVFRVKMPYKIVGQVHGFWVSGEQLSRPREPAVA